MVRSARAMYRDNAMAKNTVFAGGKNTVAIDLEEYNSHGVVWARPLYEIKQVEGAA